MSLQDSVQTLAQAAVWTDQLLPAPVHLKQLIRGKHNTAGFFEPFSHVFGLFSFVLVCHII